MVEGDVEGVESIDIDSGGATKVAQLSPLWMLAWCGMDEFL